MITASSRTDHPEEPELARSEVWPSVQWHAYSQEERQAPWKVFLPVSPGPLMLAVGLDGVGLASLARSWENVLVRGCRGHDLEWAKNQGKTLGEAYHFHEAGDLAAWEGKCIGVVIGDQGTPGIPPKKVFRLLKPGGSAAWLGRVLKVPSVARLQRFGFTPVRPYASLPPWGQKILLPLAGKRLVAAGLRFYAPFKRHMRLAVKLSRLAASLSCQNLFALKQVIVARKPGPITNDSYLFDWLSQRLSVPVSDAAVYNGWTKLALQLFDASGQTIGVGKVSDTLPGKRGIERENNTLRQLQQVRRLRHHIPQVLATGEWGGHFIQVQTYVFPDHNQYATNLTPAHVEFLRILSGLDQGEGNLCEWPHWPEFWRWTQKGELDSPAETQALREAGQRIFTRLGAKSLKFHRVHGDFTPWNAFLSPEGLKVVDWDESEPWGLPFQDAAHFYLARETYLYGKQLSVASLLKRQAVISLGEEQALLPPDGANQPLDEIINLGVLFALYHTRKYLRNS
jgi:Phosphotransferase enzyme family